MSYYDPNAPRVKTSRDYFYQAHRAIAEKDQTFLHMRTHPNHPLTDAELEKLIERRPAVWGRYGRKP